MFSSGAGLEVGFQSECGPGHLPAKLRLARSFRPEESIFYQIRTSLSWFFFFFFFTGTGIRFRVL